MSLLLERLNQFQASSDLLGIHCDASDTSRFQLGWIVDLSKTSYALISVDEVGSFDGISIGFIEDIIRLSHDGPYIKTVKASASFTRSIEMFDIRDVSANVDLMLGKAKDNRQLVSITDRNWDLVTGRIHAFDADYVELEGVGKAGELTGFELLSRSEILRLELFSSFARRICRDSGNPVPESS